MISSTLRATALAVLALSCIGPAAGCTGGDPDQAPPDYSSPEALVRSLAAVPAGQRTPGFFYACFVDEDKTLLQERDAAVSRARTAFTALLDLVQPTVAGATRQGPTSLQLTGRQGHLSFAMDTTASLYTGGTPDPGAEIRVDMDAPALEAGQPEGPPAGDHDHDRAPTLESGPDPTVGAVYWRDPQAELPEGHRVDDGHGHAPGGQDYKFRLRHEGGAWYLALDRTDRWVLGRQRDFAAEVAAWVEKHLHDRPEAGLVLRLKTELLEIMTRHGQ